MTGECDRTISPRRSVILLVALGALAVAGSIGLSPPLSHDAAHQLRYGTSAAATGIMLPSATGADLSASGKYLPNTLFGLGDPITYTVVISNSGADKVYGATMVDPLPAGLALDSDGLASTQGGLSYAGTTISWTGSLLPGSAAVVTIPVTVLTCEWPLTNTATISDLLASRVVEVSAYSEEGFEAGAFTTTATFPPPGWGQSIVSGTSAAWSLVISGTAGHPIALPRRGSAVAQFNSYTAQSGDSAILYTRRLNFPADFQPVLTFWMYHDSDLTGVNNLVDRIQVQISVDGGATYTDVPGALFYRYNSSYSNQWAMHTVGLPAYSGSSDVRIGFLGISDFGNNIYLDDVGIHYVPIAGNFGYEPAQPLVNQPVTLTGYTTGQSDQYAKTWDFGDGSPLQAGDQMTHSFMHIGTYSVSMVVCGLNVSKTLYVSSNPVGIDTALASSSPTLLGEPTTLTATTMSASRPITPTWDFGDGQAISDSLLVSHTYSAPGLYTVTLSIANAVGTVTTTTQVVVMPVADLSVSQLVSPLMPVVAHLLTYTIAISNLGPVDAAGVVLTDTLPAGADMLFVSADAVGSSMSDCSHAGNVVTCTLGVIAAGDVASVTLVVVPGAATTAANHVEVTGLAYDPNIADNSADMTVTIQPIFAYFPVMLQHYPPIPAAPALAPIDYSSANGSYTVMWHAANLAITYTLQEDTSADFSAPVTVYVGAGTSWDAVNKPAGTYYYRVGASNAAYTGDWSNVQSVVVVFPYDGDWTGATSQNRGIGFNVTQNAITSLTLNFSVGGCGYVSQQWFDPPVSITGNSFTLSRNEATFSYVVTGTFASAQSASGGISMMAWDVTGNPPCWGTANATWSSTR